MKKIMYRSYVGYRTYDDDSHEEVRGNDIRFTFFVPGSSDFDCIVVEIPDNMAAIPTWNQERKIRFWERKMSDILVDGERRRLNVNIGRRDKYYYGDIEDVNDIPEESYLPKINTYNNVELKIIDVQYTTVKENAEKFGCEYIENGKKLIRDLLKKVSREIEIHDEIKMLEKDRALRNVTTIEELKEEITIESNNYGKITGKPGQYVITVADRKYLIKGMWNPMDVDDRDSGYEYFNVYPLNPDELCRKIPAIGLPENTPKEIIEMIKEAAAYRKELIKNIGEEDWG
ncbi:hypothetical protein [Dialister invisus]|uniref:hypothetical protein n=1 Tax=Dialister invisus TaxID=218538 RepID=UPI00266FD9A8|nr:hypothetical protein [Dialister invisus]